jgi:hypothetical protein
MAHGEVQRRYRTGRHAHHRSLTHAQRVQQAGQVVGLALGRRVLGERRAQVAETRRCNQPHSWRREVAAERQTLVEAAAATMHHQQHRAIGRPGLADFDAAAGGLHEPAAAQQPLLLRLQVTPPSLRQPQARGQQQGRQQQRQGQQQAAHRDQPASGSGRYQRGKNFATCGPDDFSAWQPSMLKGCVSASCVSTSHIACSTALPQAQAAAEAAASAECEVETVQARPHRISWARLLKRVFDIDMQHCPNCGAGELKIIATILEQADAWALHPRSDRAAARNAGVDPHADRACRSLSVTPQNRAFRNPF